MLNCGFSMPERHMVASFTPKPLSLRRRTVFVAIAVFLVASAPIDSLEEPHVPKKYAGTNLKKNQLLKAKANQNFPSLLPSLKLAWDIVQAKLQAGL